MNLLILTDHSTHHYTNSFYALANALIRHPETEYVGVASRGNAINTAFFDGGRDSHLYGISISKPVAFETFGAQLETHEKLNLSQFSTILLRIPRPVNPHFFTMLIERFHGRLVVNDPLGIIKTGNKGFLTALDNFVPPVKICNSWLDVIDFARRFPIVLKPLEDYGGKGLMRIDGNRGWIGSGETTLDEVEHAFIAFGQPMLGMKFLANVHLGDKRIVLVDGEILSASIRYPAEGNWLCNVAQGGSAEYVTPDARDMEIISYLSPILDANGIFSCGIDTLVNDDGLRVISELNTLSVGGIAPAQEATGQDLSSRFADIFVRYCKRKASVNS